MRRDAHHKCCVGTGFIVLDVIRSGIGPSATEKRYAGGSCGNVLSILAYMGWNANAVGRIGDDKVGRELVEDLSKWRVNTKLLKIEAGRGTPIVVQENYIDAQGRPRHRFSRTCPMTGAKLPAYRPVLTSDAGNIAANLPLHEVFYFDRVAPGTLALAQRSRERGALVVFEPSGIKDERLFTDCLKICHIFKYANDRLANIHEFGRQARVPVEIETIGAKGLRLRLGGNGGTGEWNELRAFTAPELLDAAGAGDWTTAGIIHSLAVRGTSADQVVANLDAVVSATKFGQALAAINCGFEGARGLMYVASARRVLKLACTVSKGTKELSLDEIQSITRVDQGGDGSVGLACKDYQDLHF
jgi:fructokinase